LKTTIASTLRIQRSTEKTLKKLLADIASATRIFLKVRKARELDNDLPRDDAYTVDNKSWRKLLDMERKAFKIVENVAGMAEVVEKGESNSVG
jgi:hypothetical protein